MTTGNMPTVYLCPICEQPVACEPEDTDDWCDACEDEMIRREQRYIRNLLRKDKKFRQWFKYAKGQS